MFLFYSVHLGHFFDATEFWVPVVDFKTFTGKGIVLHALVVVGTNGVQIGAGSQLLELLLRLVHRKDLLHAVEVVTHVVLMLKDSQRAVDLVLETKVAHSLSSCKLIIY